MQQASCTAAAVPTATATLKRQQQPQSLADFNQRWSEALEWLEHLRHQLVECQTDYAAVKFANCLEADQQLFKRLPQLRSLCKEARRLCSREPQTSPRMAAMVAQLQAAWLAVESQLAAGLELCNNTSLLSALSGDLKQLVTHQPHNANAAESSMQQVVSVAQDASKLLDWINNSKACHHHYHHGTRQCQLSSTVSTASASATSRLCSSSSSSSATRNRRHLAVEGSSRSASASVSTATGSCRQSRSTSAVADGYQAGWTYTSHGSSEAFIFSGPILGGNDSFHNDDPLAQRPDRRAASLDDQDAATAAAAAGQHPIDSSNVALTNGSSSCAYEAVLHKEAVDDADSRTTCDNSDIDFYLPTDKSSEKAPASDQQQLRVRMSPWLKTVANRLDSLKAAVSIAQALLLGCTGSDSTVVTAAERNQLLSQTAAALVKLQRETASLKATVVDRTYSRSHDELIRQAYLKSITLLARWTDSLYERCLSKLQEFSLAKNDNVRSSK